LEDPSSYINLVARAHQHDAAVPAGPALSAPGLVAGTESAPGAAAIYAMTAPRAHERWLGNAFRYGLRSPGSPLEPPAAVDRDGEPALDAATGLPRPGSRNDWSESPDADLLAGGASGRLPLAPARRVFSELASSDITDSRNRLTPDNAIVDRTAVGLGSTDPETPAQVVAWMLSARPIGDPGARAPVVIDYHADGIALAFVATQDGLLHAFDAASGVERWAWLPRALMPRLARLMRDQPATARSHGIDGALVLHRFDPDGDGVIERDAGEHLWLMFGLGRGGGAYYALDIADPDQPRLLWSRDFGADDASPGAEPVIARLSIASATRSGGNWVVLLAAGGSLRLLDATTGSTLWSAAASDADLLVPELTVTLASAPRALDLDGDGQLDRSYLLDPSGGLWRFDFTPGAAPAELARARRIARLGAGTRHFQASPDVSIATIGGRREIAIAAGSGRADLPRDVTTIDRVYVLFDRGATRELLEADLHDVTDGGAAMPATAPGWFLRLDGHGPGEKVIGSSVTFDHVLRFQTYQPLAWRDDEPCGPPRALLRRYARDIRSGLPIRNAAAPDRDEETALEAPGLPVELRFAFPSPADAPCPGCRARPFGIAGARTFDPGYAGDPVRTSWRKLQPAADSR
jgi:type IV pilus assembly protein PilY1